MGTRATVTLLCLAVAAGAAESPAGGNATVPDADDLYQLGQQLFDQYAPPEVKEQYEFPSKAEWDAFVQKLPAAQQGDSLAELAKYGPQARAALQAMRASGVDDDLADWLSERLDEIEGAQQAEAAAAQPPPRSSPQRPTAPARPSPPPRTPAPKRAPASSATKPGTPAAIPSATAAAIPHYALWYQRVQKRPVPARAGELMPTLRSAFTGEGVPAALVWLAEAESSLNPTARGPTGARGLFQLMPDTAKGLGLDTWMPDERVDPAKSARAAARYLRELHGKFGQWPLALAAYNAGEGRVARALAARKARDYAGIADSLPAETRMYVPKVCALVATRAGVDVASL
jgi:membrane-bound lytic murein transglycosylase D